MSDPVNRSRRANASLGGQRDGICYWYASWRRAFDTSFNGTGIKSVNVGALPAASGVEITGDEIYGLAVRPNGSVLVTGYTKADPLQPSTPLLVQFTAAGLMDTSFGANGFVNLSASGGGNSVVLRPGGDAVLGGSNLRLAQVAVNGVDVNTLTITSFIRRLSLQSDNKVLATGFFSGGSQNFRAMRFVVTDVPDASPDPFTFADVTNVAFGATAMSAPLTITGLTTQAGVSVTNGEFSVGCAGPWSGPGQAGFIHNRQQICVRNVAGSSSLAQVQSVLTIGDVSRTFVSIAGDATPDAFTFGDQSGSRECQRRVCCHHGREYHAATPISVTGGDYSVGCTSTFTNAAGIVSDGQTVCVRHTSSTFGSTATSTTLNVGGISDVFTSTTAADPPPPPAPRGGGGAMDWLLLLLSGSMLLARARSGATPRG